MPKQDESKGQKPRQAALESGANRKRLPGDLCVPAQEEAKKLRAAFPPSTAISTLSVHAPSILYRNTGEPSSSKLAAFDLDGTLVEWKAGRRFSLAADSWVWFNAQVPAKLRVRILLTNRPQKLLMMASCSLEAGEGALNQHPRAVCKPWHAGFDMPGMLLCTSASCISCFE